jgi:hypothetical protein
MNNTEKKLDALINALGFDVEESHVLDVDNYKVARLVSFGMFEVNKDYIHPEFKFTKRDEPLDVLYDGVSLRQLVENVKGLSGLDGKYRWIKYPKCSYDAVYEYLSSKMDIKVCVSNFQVFGVKVMLDKPVDKDESNYGYMKQIKELVIKSGIPKSVIYDLIEGAAPVDDAPTEKANKPPLGLRPATMAGIRGEEIITAIIRYSKDKKPIPEAWATELYSLWTASL